MVSLRRVLLLLLLLPTSSWRIAPAAHHHLRASVHRRPVLQASITMSEHTPPPRPIRTLNSSTKWLVTAAQTFAVWYRRDFIAPFIVVGAILATFGTTVLKRLINQQRPAGAPFTDPGMPSSHALVATFAAVAWALHFQAAWARVTLLASAALVSVLRVVCGYHSWAQIVVGTLVGASTAYGWMGVGDVVVARVAPRTAVVAAWACYLAGSAAFIAKKMPGWLGKERDL